MSENPIKYTDLFDFSENGGIKGAIRDIKNLTTAYKEFSEIVTGGTLKMLTDQQKALADTVRQLSEASKELNITNKASQQQLLENAAAMSKLEAQSKLLTQTKKAAKVTDDAVAGSVNQLTASLASQVAQYKALGNTEQRDIVLKRQLVQSINTTRVQLANLNGAIRQNTTAFSAAAGSYNQLDAETKKLIVDLKNLPNAFTTNSAKAKEMQAAINANVAKLKEFDKAMNITTRNVGNYSSAFSQIGSSIQSMLGPLAIFMASLAAVRKVIANNAEISDSLADVRRTAQLTEVEADKLLDTLKQFDTRTSLKGLADIAVIAGQLGIAKNDIAGFVQSIDQLSVVLAKEIPGGAEATATALGKINGVFKTQVKEGTTIDEAYNKTGSAILALGQAGLATGGYLQEFALRTAGVAQSARISLPTILAYSAVLEETGSTAEVAGTAFNRLVGSLASKRDKFFAIAKLADAKLTIKEFTDIINTDANKALQLFFQGLNKSQNLTQFIDLLGEIKIKAGPAQNAIIALAQNQEKLNLRVEQSVDAYDAGSLASEQFKIKNDNLAGSLDKLGNAMTNISTDPNSKLGRLFKFIIDSCTDAINALDKLFDKFSEANDRVVIKNAQSGRGNLFTSDADVAAAFQRRRDANTAALKDDLTGRGSSTADILSAGKSQLQLQKLITAETDKRNDAQKRLNYNLSYIKDPKNVGEPLEAQIRNTNKLRVATFQQAAVVDRLKETYKKLYPEIVKATDGDKFKDTSKADKSAEAERKRLEDAEKRAIAAQENILQSSAKYSIAELELQYAQGKQSTEDEIKFENDKLKVLEDSYALRFKLYDKDSEEYKKIQIEKLDAEKDNILKVAKIQKEADDKAKKAKEKLDKAIGGANAAQVNLDTETKIADLNKGKASGSISDSDFNKQLFDIRKNDIQEEIDAAQAQMDKFTEIDSEYFEAKKDKLNAEKELVKEKSDYEISQAEIVAEKKKQTEQAVYDFVNELSGSLFEIGASLNEAKIEELEHQRDTELTIAGDNADAKAKIQEKYDKKILAQKRKQAVFDKLEALFNIGVNTAVAVTKVLAQTGILSPFVVPGIIAAGALQAAAVIAKPLPKYKVGRKGGKSEFAIVNDGSGPEILEKNGKFRIAGNGKETVTMLQDGEIVHTAEKSAKMMYDEFQNSFGASRFVDNLIVGQGIMRAKEESSQKALISAIIANRLSKSDLNEAFSKAIGELEIQQLFIDEKGHNTFLRKRNQKIHDQNSRNTFGGQG